MTHHNPSHPLVLVAVLALVALGASSAQAQDAAGTDRWSRHFTLSGTLAGPTGFFGAELEYAPLPQIGINVGAGLLSSDVQASTMLRFRYVFADGTALGVGLGSSFGTYVDSENGRNYDFTNDTFWKRHWAIRVWGNAELAVEHRSAGRFYWRIGVGVETPFDGLSSTATCQVIRTECGESTVRVYPYAQLALGAVL